MMIRLVALGLIVGALAGCSAPVKVAPPRTGVYETKVPGNYAVMLQTGAWHKGVESKGFTCSAWTFETNFDDAYKVAAEEAFRGGFENVDFTHVELAPDEVASKGYDAQIIVYQGGLDAQFVIREEMFSGSMIAEVGMDGIVAVTTPEGLVAQQSPRGQGKYEKSLMLCSEGDEVVARAGGNAILEYLRNAVGAAREQVLLWRNKKLAADLTS
jgi:hypothetical protein